MQCTLFHAFRTQVVMLPTGCFMFECCSQFLAVLNSLQLHSHPAGSALHGVQSAAPQPSSDQKPKSDNLTLRRRQSFNFGDNRAGPLVPSEAGRAPSGRLPGAPTTQQALRSKSPATAAALPAANAAPERTQRKAVGGLPLHRAASKLPKPAGEAVLKGPSAVLKKTDTGLAGGLSSSKSQINAPAKSYGAQSLQRTAGSGDAAQAMKPSGARSPQRAAAARESQQVKRQGSSPAQLVDKYKRDAAARKQRQNEVTLERISSLAAGLQHAASGSLGATDAGAISSAHKQARSVLPVATPSSSRRSPMQGKAAVASRHPTAARMQGVHPQTGRDKTLQDTAKTKLRVTQGATSPASAVTHSSSSSEDF